MLLLQTAKAAKTDSLLVFLKNSGLQVIQKDSADYYRVVLPPDSSVDRDLYRVFEFYANGKTKTVAMSLTQSYPSAFQGTCIEYFPNGKRKRITFYDKGLLVDTVKTYYPNGKLYYCLKIENQTVWYDGRYSDNFFRQNLYGYKLQMIELRDSTGKVLTEKGSGHLLIYDDDFKNLIDEGDIKNNKKEGEWRGTIADSGAFLCTFHKDELKSGISYMKSGHHYPFKKIYEPPAFEDWRGAFNHFIETNLKYPESARKYKITGSVDVQFDIDPDGSVSNVKVDRGLLKTLDDEAVRVISMSPSWHPACQYGIPVRAHQRISVSFFQVYYNHSQ